ncbi:hypothetical protein GJAV_G00172070 [Gymnothorax javanicus]|nr:hypothetical protein GJAV_G00172070 [Gymnothorax javanicus]
MALAQFKFFHALDERKTTSTLINFALWGGEFFDRGLAAPIQDGVVWKQQEFTILIGNATPVYHLQRDHSPHCGQHKRLGHAAWNSSLGMVATPLARESPAFEQILLCCIHFLKIFTFCDVQNTLKKQNVRFT